MSKRHFIQLADTTREISRGIWAATCEQYDVRTPSELPADVQERTEQTIRYQVIKPLADFCASQNGDFMRSRWIAYIAGECGPSGGVKSKVA